ncbi:hypothetical protein ACFLQK_00670 [bacterium]
MADIRNFRKYIEEVSGNNLLKKKIAALERKQAKLEKQIAEMKDDVKLVKKAKADVLPKKKGRKPRPMIKVIEDEMAKAPGKKMYVKDIVRMLKKKNVKSKATNVYSSVASSLTHNPKFEKIGPGQFKLVGAAKPKPRKKKKKAKKKKKK